VGRILLGADLLQELVTLELTQPAVRLRRVRTAHPRGGGPVELLEHRVEAVALRDAVRLGQEDELTPCLARTRIEELR
jgi:hypothetical protein